VTSEKQRSLQLSSYGKHSEVPILQTHRGLVVCVCECVCVLVVLWISTDNSHVNFILLITSVGARGQLYKMLLFLLAIVAS